MRKLLLLIALLGAAGAYAEYNDAYYQAMDGKSKEALKAAAKLCVQNHQTLNYGQLPGYWQYTDVYPELVNGCKRWWEMYSDEVCLIQPNQNAFQSFSSYGMNREHSVPKSWWKYNNNVEYTPCYSDMWNLYPSNGAANQAKLNYPFGPTDNPRFDNGVTKVGPPRAGYGGGASNVFEPADEYKGDFARSIFYVATVYDDIHWTYKYMFVEQAYPTLTPWAMNMLLQWSRKDPVSQKEIERNNLVEQYQGNRNPFVDFPELAEYIWGLRTDETFIIADQPNTGHTPDINGDPEITEPVNGEVLEFGPAAVNHSVTRALQIRGANFTKSLSVRVAGADRDFFHPETTSISAATLNSNGGYLLPITYLPTGVGSHEARLILYDGGLEGSVVVNLSGSAEPEPTFTTIHALPATAITATGYTANWEAPADVADYYVVTRVRYTGMSEESETYETGETSVVMTDRDPEVAESYSVTYSRLGLTSPSSNVIYVAADSGISTLQTGVPFRAIAVAEGVLILSGDGEAVEALAIYDTQGRAVALYDRIEHNTTIALGPGAYVVAAPGKLPQKVIVTGR